jgi:hypothetical protein
VASRWPSVWGFMALNQMISGRVALVDLSSAALVSVHRSSGDDGFSARTPSGRQGGHASARAPRSGGEAERATHVKTGTERDGSKPEILN